MIAYDRLIRDSDLDLYLSFDNVRVGEMQAKARASYGFEIEDRELASSTA